jgi:DNA-binding response OmpR family regulator
MKILMICNNRDVAETIKEFFDVCGHKCEVATDRKSAVLLLFLNKFDVVIADLPLPGFDYSDLLISLKCNTAAKVKVFIVAETDFSTNATNILREIGITGVLKKPISVKILERML